MFKKIKASFTSPREIPFYKNDNLIFAFIYLFILCFLASLPTLIRTVKIKHVSYETRDEIRRLLTEEYYYMPHGCIEDGTLYLENEPKSFYLGGAVEIILPTDYVEPYTSLESSILYAVNIKDEGIEVYFAGNCLKTYSYEELGLKDIKFDFAIDNDYLARMEGFGKIEAAYEMVVMDLAGYWKTIEIVGSFLRSIVMCLVFYLIIALLSKGISGLTFKNCLNIAIYSFAIETVGGLLTDLYGLVIFEIVGAILGFVYYIIALINSRVKIDM